MVTTLIVFVTLHSMYFGAFQILELHQAVIIFYPLTRHKKNWFKQRYFLRRNVEFYLSSLFRLTC
jgi:hypothetical protein